MRRVLAGTDVDVTLQLRDADGEPATPAAAPQVAVVDGAGDQVAGSPFAGDLAGDVVTLTLPDAVTATLDRYRLSSSADTAAGATLTVVEHVETVGGFLFGLGDLRRRVHRYNDPTEHPVASLRQLRTAVEQRIETAARRSFAPRGRRMATRVDARGRIGLPDIDVTALVAVTVDGVAVDLADVEISDVDWGWVQPASGAWSPGDVATLAYRYGLTPTPQPIVDAALELAGASTVTPTIPARATAMSTEMGTWRITVPGRDGPTGIPDVDVAIAEWGRGDPVFA